MSFSNLGQNSLMRGGFVISLMITLAALWPALSMESLIDMAEGIGSSSGEASGQRQIQSLIMSMEDLRGRIFLVAGLFALFMIGVVLPCLYNYVVKPSLLISNALNDLLNGDKLVSLDFGHRKGVIGDLARTVLLLQKSLIEKERLAQASKISQANALEDARNLVLRGKVSSFSNELSANAASLDEMTRRMIKASNAMVSNTREAEQGAQKARHASDDAFRNVSFVANATEQLLESVEEINRQVVQSTSVVRTAVSETRESAAGVMRLTNSVSKVGDIVSLISRIAAQTNLLALNATIEAARAGEAGRGFAVVAQEVKTLATQTAKATQDIAGQITEMQTATDLSVAAIDTIQRKISEVEQITAVIAAAVHEQGVSTQEITRSVRSAANGASDMSVHTNAVAGTLNETGLTVEGIVKLANDLDRLSADISRQVNLFAKDIAA